MSAQLRDVQGDPTPTKLTDSYCTQSELGQNLKTKASQSSML